MVTGYASSLRFLLLGLILAALSWPIHVPTALAQQMDVDLELVLAADGSGSIDDGELALQRDGYAEAIADPEILTLIQGGLTGRIAVAYVEWGGPFSQHTIVDWTVIDGAESAAAFGRSLRAAPRQATGYNSISNAIDYSVTMMETNRYDGLRRIVDVSADGPNIGGRPITAARDEAVSKGVTINALLVLHREGGLPGWDPEELVGHYERDVIGGFGAFVMTVNENRTFAEAVRAKMILEVARALGLEDRL
ncbi:DUF1194 domain-containing protein [Marivibrio halodurans]|uniref:DUF1194 domain-containing protein n=1 Tax=Marivibrio halodurans TaxID=2039722 RepID=A0A8J7S1G5_9PROT|nr:DUF1194 domain-containing protein [Marivibrio halodurans]MBP5856873.1 DUF1194 domain-containing protein [Marivibrio halodurans]